MNKAQQKLKDQIAELKSLSKKARKEEEKDALKKEKKELKNIEKELNKL